MAQKKLEISGENIKVSIDGVRQKIERNLEISGENLEVFIDGVQQGPVIPCLSTQQLFQAVILIASICIIFRY